MCEELESSYKNNLSYEQVFQSIISVINPDNIVEFGILNGFSLLSMVKIADISCKIQAYDIFEKFNGNYANKNKLEKTFKNYSNVSINYGDFYEIYQTLASNLDIIHIDIANDGHTYVFAIEHYLSLLKKGGVLLLEGGSHDRDNIHWMIKYNKQKSRSDTDRFFL